MDYMRLARSLVSMLGSVTAACTEPSMGVDPIECEATPLVTPGPTTFVDISAASGIQANNFVTSPATPIPINDHSRLGFADINGDGCDDIVAHDLFPNAQNGVPFTHLVFENRCDGTFEDVSVASGLRDVQAGFFAFGDVDNDGDQDAFAGLDIPLPGTTSSLWLNDGTGVFTQRLASGLEGTAGSTTAGSAVFADFNSDGKLDLFVGNGQTSFNALDDLFLGNGDTCASKGPKRRVNAICCSGFRR